MRSREFFAPAGLDELTRLRQSFDRGAELTKAEAQRMWGWNERRFRARVSQLREEGYPVISLSEQGSRYRKARDRRELDDFIDRELVSRTRDIEAQIRALRDGADKHFGTPQMALEI